MKTRSEIQSLFDGTPQYVRITNGKGLDAPTKVQTLEQLLILLTGYQMHENGFPGSPAWVWVQGEALGEFDDVYRIVRGWENQQTVEEFGSALGKFFRVAMSDGPRGPKYYQLLEVIRGLDADATI